MKQHDKNVKAEFGKIIAGRRAKLGLTQEQVADRCGTAKNYIGELERGEKQPALTMLLALADALEWSPIELIRALQKALLT